MGSIIDRALDIINDHLKDQTSSFPDPITVKPMARGGEVLEDKYPSHYMPGVGRQVMAAGGEPDPINRALGVARAVPEEPAAIPAPAAPKARTSLFEGRVQSPGLSSTFGIENRPGVVVSPRPGKGGGPSITPEAGVHYPHPEYEGYGAQGEEPTSHEAFSFATPDIMGAPLPPPVQHPLQNEPRLQKISENTQRILKTPGFRKLVEEHVGLKGPLSVMPTVGTWKNEMEPSFILQHPDMDEEGARKLAHILGFGFQQDAVVHAKHNPDLDEGIPALLIGNGKKLKPEHIDQIADAAKKEGLDFTVTGDGKAAKFLHFGGDNSYDGFLDSVNRVADAAKMNHRYHARTQGDLIDAKDYLNGIFGSTSQGEGLPTGTERSPDLFGRIVDHVLAPYAKAVAGEGYRLSPERLAQTFGLTQDEENKVRESLYPGAKGDRTTVPLMNGTEDLDVRPTGARGNATVNDVLYALQNRAAEKGQIDPGDFSDKAKKSIASDIADEVKYHVDNSDKSAVGWYDAALKKAKAMYHTIFPELKTDKDKEMLFDAILGITSQGNDVHSNSVFAARMYDKMRNEGKSIAEAAKELGGGFGAQTKAIEGNLMKLHHLLDQNGYDRMRDLFNQKKTVSEWNKILRTDPSFKVPGQEQLKMQGAGDQKVTGWMVFGPKIGSFINNLHGDYSTLTADLWFSRTWNRLLGHNFIHAPLAEQKQYQDFKDAIKAEFLHHNGLEHEQYAGKTSEGQYQRDASGNVKPWTFGNDMKDMSHDEFHDLINDPEKMQELASHLYEEYKGGGFKDKSDARRRAKNWMENRSLPVAAPRGDKEREFQQNTVEEAQKLLKKKYGLDISVADIQAALWFHEKELFSKLGVAPERAQPADYADAAAKTMDLINKKELYRVKSKEKAAKAYGGAITPIEVRGHDLDDEARRLILWSYATAPLFGRAEGGRTYPVAMTKEADNLDKKHAKLKKMSPQEFLNETDPLHIGKGDRKVIDTFKHDIRGGHHLGPLKIYNNGGQDGRHRANAAKELGIKSVPVIDYRKADGGSVDGAQNAVDIARGISSTENDLLNPIGQSKMVGPDEKLLFDEGTYKAGMSSYPWNKKRSIRYIHHDENDKPIGTLQIMTDGPRSKKATIQNVYVSENVRRQKIASGLLARARQDYDVKHSKDLTTQGRAFAKSVKAAGGPVDDAQNAVDIAHNLTPMGFYSAAAEAASKIPQRAPIDQILNKLKGSPNVKPEELDLSGARAAFSGQKSVDPKDVAAHLQANLPPIQETVYGYDSKTKRQTNMSPKYEQYTFPGGNNYREVLLHLPTKEDGDYQSSHWDTPNVVAHLRMADRGMYGLGEPEALHIEEVQSDWGQDAREHGTSQSDESELARITKEVNETKSALAKAKSGSDEESSLTDKLYDLRDQFRKLQSRSSVPHGPHIGSTEGWTDLALKRALMEAAKGKYKKLTFTTGEDQADRYGLDKSYSQIHYSPETKELYAKGKDGVEDIHQRVHPDALHSFIGKELAQKLLDRPLIANTQPYVSGDKVHSLIGGQLAVEQKGMRDYYDRMLPNRLQKLVSKLDPEAKVQLFGHKTWVPEDTWQSEDDESEPGDYKKVHSLEITPNLRAAILKGLPAFDHGGSVVKKAFKVLSNLSR